MIKKCIISKDKLLEYSVSFLPPDDKVLGVTGRYMYIEIVGHLQVPGADNREDDIVFLGEVLDQTFVLRVTIAEYQKLFRLWIEGKKRICESYGHWCGAFGNIHVGRFKVVGYSNLTRFDEIKDCDDPGFVYMEEVPIIQVIEWNTYTDFEHG